MIIVQAEIAASEQGEGGEEAELQVPWEVFHYEVFQRW